MKDEQKGLQNQVAKDILGSSILEKQRGKKTSCERDIVKSTHYGFSDRSSEERQVLVTEGKEQIRLSKSLDVYGKKSVTYKSRFESHDDKEKHGNFDDRKGKEEKP